MNPPLYSIVIATFNRAPMLDVTLGSLCVQTADVPFEIIVVDNNSSDNTRAIVGTHHARFPERIRYVSERTQGLSAARNAGIQAARGRVIVFVDDDVVAQLGWLQALASTYATYPHAACVGGRVVLQLPDTTPAWLDITGIMGTFLSQLDYGQETRELHYPEAIMGTNFSVRRETLADLGVFRTDLGRIGTLLLSGEEVDLCRRIQRAGKSVYYCGLATLAHQVPESRLEKRFFRRRAYWEGRTAGVASAWPAMLARLTRESLVMLKDWAYSLIYVLAGDRRRSFEHEIAAWKRLGYLHQSVLSRKAARNGERVGHYIRGVIEAMVPEVGKDMIGPRSLVLAPHPDDEVLGCGGTIARSVRDGADVWIGFLTDGRRGIHDGTGDPVAVRKAEAIKAADALGLSSDRLFFFGCEDGRLAEQIDQVTERARRIVDDLNVNALFIPYRGDWHPDHQAAWAIGEACRGKGTLVLEYPIWFGPWLWPRLGWKSRVAAALHLRDVIHAVKVRIAEVADVKQRALAAYDSQVLALRSQPWGTAFLDNFKSDHEIFVVRRKPRR